MGHPDRPGWPQRLVLGPDWPFVGRAAELDRLERAWDAALAGRRQLVLLGGEPGAGKSHLAATAGRRFHDRGAVVTLGLSFAELGVPFQPVAEVLTHLLLDDGSPVLDDLDEEHVVELARLVPALAGHRAGRTGSGTGPAPDDRRRLFDAVVVALRACCARWPLVVVLEDLHWAGGPSIQLLAHLVRSTSAEPLLIIATHRTTRPDRSDLLADTVAELHRFEGVTRIDLPGLGVDAVAQFLVATGVVPVPQARRFAPLLTRQTGGNPFFLRELWRHAEVGEGIVALLSPATPRPRSIADTLELRLRALPPDQVSVLEVAAVIGDPVEARTIVAAGAAGGEVPGPGAVDAALDAGVATGILHLLSSGDLSYTFVHDLARQVLIDRIPPARRAVLHACVARAVEGLPHPVHRRSARLAHHWSEARTLDHEGNAVRWLEAAGREAERSLAFEEAMTHLERAAQQLPPDDPRWAAMVLAAARNAVNSGAFADGRRLYEQLAEHDDIEVVARAAIGYEDASWRPGLRGRTVELLGDAAHRLPVDHELRVPVLAALGRALAFEGRSDQAQAIGEHAIELARERGDDRLLATALQASLWNRVTPETAELHLHRSREGGLLALRLRDWELLGTAATYRGSRAYQLGLLDDWRQSRHDLEQSSRRSGQRFYAYMGRCSDYALAFIHGDLVTAEAIVEELLELGGAFGQDDTEGVYGLQTFMLRRETGRLDEVRPLITGDEEPGTTYWAPGLLALYTELGLTGGVRRLVSRLLQGDLEAERLTAQWDALMAFLAEAVHLLGDQVAARRLLPYLRPHAGRNLSAGHFVALFGSADRYLGMLLHLLDDPRAEEHFQAALELDRAMGAVVHEAHTLARYAELLDRTDPAAATRARDDARRIAARHGMRELVAGTASGSAPPPDGLTGREVEVLRCLARGLSNREIAASLYIAENTAANHVRSILRKTGSANRTKAALYAAEHALV